MVPILTQSAVNLVSAPVRPASLAPGAPLAHRMITSSHQKCVFPAPWSFPTATPATPQPLTASTTALSVTPTSSSLQAYSVRVAGMPYRTASFATPAHFVTCVSIAQSFSKQLQFLVSLAPWSSTAVFSV